MKKITLLLPVFLITLSLGGISHVANACSYSNGGAATAGDDTINCTDTVADSSVDALAGNDTVTVNGNGTGTQVVDVDLGDGDNTLTIIDDALGTISAGAGFNTITVTDSTVNNMNLSLGTATVILRGSTVVSNFTSGATVTVNMSGTSSITSASNVIGGTFNLSENSTIGSLIAPYESLTANLSGSSIVDTLDLGQGTTEVQAILLEGNSQVTSAITFHGGDDTITIRVPKANFDATTQLICGAGNDTVTIDETAGATGYGDSITLPADCENLVYTQVPEVVVGSKSGSRRRSPEQVSEAFGYDIPDVAMPTATSTEAGCTNSGALNHNQYALVDNGSCLYAQEQIPDDFVFGQSCSRVFNEYVGEGNENEEVTLWQKFLNFGFNESIPETGYFGEKTKGGVKRFQEFFTGAILSPWGLTEGTGQVYQTTRSWANRITGCPEEGFVVEGKTVNHATFAIPRGYDFLNTFNTPNETGYSTLSNPLIVPTTTYVPPVTVATPPQVNVTLPFVTTPVMPVQAPASATGDSEIDALLQAITNIESQIDSLN